MPWWWAVVVVVVIATALWWWLPKWQVNLLRLDIPDAKARADVEDNFRKTIGQLLGGAAVLVGTGFAYHESQLAQQATHEKAKGWALKDLASHVLREDAEAISPQYLNDIEHDRRSPSSDRMVQQFADALGIDRDWLYYLAGRFPEDVRDKKLSEKQVVEAMVAFRGGPRKGKGRS